MMHPGAFDYLKPTEEQMSKMTTVRITAAEFGDFLDRTLPEGPDKTYVMRKFREAIMWANVTLTRLPDGAPRT